MLTRRTFIASATAASTALLIPRGAFASEPPVFQSGGIAINGFDPVAYFTMGKPVEGRADLTSDWNGATVQFADEAHKAMFDADPEKYAPRYGGYCAYAVSKGYTASTDPAAWSIYEGRLYLNYSRIVRGLWERDKPGHVARADANWPGVLDS